ncbi:uncharacterized protein B0H18DRAFT_79945 [Fomitopsis serialis]|uniref:uncharacterized protein n=1 Tax=Fomitopsis serialis TaxID=139415 RepID=UPI0020079500|nr:uncharacterized protein B0H18DRAFT_79945 [Neoantrodia serialis]KAH9915900.1 hypothetical protein B0H18DRAFT_79945 [Neoantrodia serialis]
MPIEMSDHLISRTIAQLRQKDVLKTSRMTVDDTVMGLPNSPHALCILPLFAYGSDCYSEEWSSYSREIKSKETRELFRTHHGKTYYIGTYQAVEGLALSDIRLEDVDTKLLKTFDRTAKGVDLEAGLTRLTTPAVSSKNSVAQTVPQMYQLGILRVAVVGLQYVGFNQRLNEELHPRDPPSGEASADVDSDSETSLSLVPRGLKQRKRRLLLDSSSDEEPPHKEAKVSKEVSSSEPRHLF